MPKSVGSSPLRVFCALELPAPVRAQVANHLQTLRQTVATAQAKWEHPEKLHLTIKFLGEISPTQLAELKQATAQAAAQVPPFEIRIEQAGCFPPRGQARVLWLGITDASRRLAQLHQALEAACFQAGFPREPRAFHPHLTLARLKGAPTDRALVAAHQQAVFNPVAFSVTEMVVMRSELLPGGSRYTVLERCRFNAEKN
ncbi:MAG: RNA 2',3'-cyclic phosphodiesterase [Blastocatellia bacterium]|nr:RNA 2',3'-cyclic phosphodiesterase [Blastocatellia bacterium]